MIHFILGGAKSGKSQYAEMQMKQYAQPWIYLATGRAWDDEMKQKIQHHQERRGTGWITVEEPIQIADYIKQPNRAPILIDCLTLWLTNLMMDERDIEQETIQLVDALQSYGGDIFIVSNEVGQGIVPVEPMARAFRNYAGILHQKIASIADDFTFIVAGYPMKMKS
ncbi:Adenosyl cobinamide kinase/adenosyl cobinamide phosphate guanylyltransferase (CobU) (PDB:1C9K) [Commensalibacter communis]|uniref:bifunctional adenosylcobinamide kinase/adenosylcobinamide-phosphate guanylyltransferase n=1 Tax=Commensalibacter communis TaxID=2972786 RepID=UPI0022FFBAFB|nr:bifunctional adenosylcobinamide kinase/adenosylcobinamide-phosphate guanylyltransferase [Commensalibacter communis]CAI3950124.1 Adenosyl cobinamide kinase/adenosyl cobinamide phosphate guanylyltransferase (CobU) (PDB:1C9K) [Commensalibacter communis]CAI3950591.1 Adenosyl cobinamide kinase/adenosyl cobinamide phosphate guanylyltransferase (CobU) (PDB:1C9K) [Commensalibacter communis]